MSDAPSIRRWVYDLKAARPIWAIRKFHDIGHCAGGGTLVSVNFGYAEPGDTICMDSTGRYWVEKAAKTEGKK